MNKHHIIVGLNGLSAQSVPVQIADRLDFWWMPQDHHEIVCMLPLLLLDTLRSATLSLYSS